MEQEHLQRFFLELAYDGTQYHGWQIQQNAMSVQEKLNQALATILRKPIETVGCGRTDTGVHAKQLYAHFDLAATDQISERFIYQLNALLPSDIVVKNLYPVDQQAHARFDAVRRAYEYHVHFEKDPFRERFSWQLRARPDMHAMNEAAKVLFDYKDFSCFSKSNTQVFTNNCTIFEAYWEEVNEGLVFHIAADRFLRNMVRAIVGTLLEIGYGKQPLSYMHKVIESKNRSIAGTSVPAHGLYLTSVVYPDTVLQLNHKL
jgi:tRNA pseudouridine38-40 synthase